MAWQILTTQQHIPSFPCKKKKKERKRKRKLEQRENSSPESSKLLVFMQNINGQTMHSWDKTMQAQTWLEHSYTTHRQAKVDSYKRNKTQLDLWFRQPELGSGRTGIRARRSRLWFLVLMAFLQGFALFSFPSFSSSLSHGLIPSPLTPEWPVN